MDSYKSYMTIALQEAELAGKRGEIPVGAVIINPEGRIIAQAGNRNKELNDPTAHAEVLCIREACKATSSSRLPYHSIYVTLEPCPMCQAILEIINIKRIFYGASNFFHKKHKHTRSHMNFLLEKEKKEIYQGICEKEATKLLKDFFKQIRARNTP